MERRSSTKATRKPSVSIRPFSAAVITPERAFSQLHPSSFSVMYNKYQAFIKDTESLIPLTLDSSNSSCVSIQNFAFTMPSTDHSSRRRKILVFKPLKSEWRPGNLQLERKINRTRIKSFEMHQPNYYTETQNARRSDFSRPITKSKRPAEKKLESESELKEPQNRLFDISDVISVANRKFDIKTLKNYKINY